METLEKLPNHLNTAVNAIQKQIDTYDKHIQKLMAKRKETQDRIDSLQEEISGLREQIAKLKGE